MNPEETRLEETRSKKLLWKLWGPYLSERQWGTVREDYSEDGDAWNHFTHDQARSRAYRWGEDGIAGISDFRQRLCFAVAVWNGQDPIIKERLFGLTNSEGNHGEDVKEYYYYLDNTPTHSYMKYLYKYPQSAYPYQDLVDTNRGRTRQEAEYELIDTGVFEGDRYFDVLIEYAKAAPEDILIRITVSNRGPAAAEIHVLPTLWFRNAWSWTKDAPKPSIERVAASTGVSVVQATHRELVEQWLSFEGEPPLLFTENETNTERLSGVKNESPFVKDGINDFVVQGKAEAVNPAQVGTKTAGHYRLRIDPGASAVVRLRLCDSARIARSSAAFEPQVFEATFADRLREADLFYDGLTPEGTNADAASVMRQALAGMLWTKQYYYFELDRWLADHDAHPLLGGRRKVRNREWYHMVNDDVISMPDKWEYPWYAAWDLAFHTIALNMVDHDFAKKQLDLMISESYLHPSGQIPAYEWNFSDVNPPVHAFATLFTYSVGKQLGREGEIDYLKSAFQRLLLNFTWWVNRKDAGGDNIFSGGFLGLDNIGVFDRSAKLPMGGHLEQADGTAWMAFFCQNMLEIALEIALHDPSYEVMAVKFLEHFLWIAASVLGTGEKEDGLWDEEDGCFYDVLRLPDGTAMKIRVRSMVGLLPLCASTVISSEHIQKFPKFVAKIGEFLTRHEKLLARVHPPEKPGERGRHLLSMLNEDRLRRILSKVLDEKRLLSPFGIRSLSKWHLEHPYVFKVGEEELKVGYLPAESDSGMFGGNSNWRGPIWLPLNFLIIRGLFQLYLYYGDSFTVECPAGSGKRMNLYQVATEIMRRITRIFTRDSEGRRPVHGGNEKFQTDPHWRDHLLFYEYFHGDNGAGLGASHQTGWTGLVARLVQMLAYMYDTDVLTGEVSPATNFFRGRGR